MNMVLIYHQEDSSQSVWLNVRSKPLWHLWGHGQSHPALEGCKPQCTSHVVVGNCSLGLCQSDLMQIVSPESENLMLEDGLLRFSACFWSWTRKHKKIVVTRMSKAKANPKSLNIHSGFWQHFVHLHCCESNLGIHNIYPPERMSLMVTRGNAFHSSSVVMTAYIYIYIYTYTYTYTHIYIYIHVCIYGHKLD